MATNPDKPGDPPPPKKTGRVQDYFIEPLPVPDAHESDGDTVWGMWEDSLAQHSGERPGEGEPGFEKTHIAPLDDDISDNSGR